jgi:hypothetical protein
LWRGIVFVRGGRQARANFRIPFQVYFEKDSSVRLPSLNHVSPTKQVPQPLLHVRDSLSDSLLLQPPFRYACDGILGTAMGIQISQYL